MDARVAYASCVLLIVLCAASSKCATQQQNLASLCRGQKTARIVSSSVWSQTFYIGDKIKLMCYGCGHPRPKVTWYKDGAEIIYQPNMRVTEWRYKKNKVRSYIEIDPATEANAGQYMCKASNRNGYDERTITMTALYPNVQG